MYRMFPSRRSKVARDVSRSLRPTCYNHARLSQACSYYFESLWDLPERPSGRQEPTIQYKLHIVEAGSKRRRGGWGVPSWWLEKGAHMAAASIASRVPRAWRAERERSANTHATQV
eukprot:6172132-Pleurochrysis_carterae.AAC.1